MKRIIARRVQRQEISQVCKDLWEYYRQLQDYKEHPCPEQKQVLSQRFDQIFGKRYPHHYGLNLAMEQNDKVWKKLKPFSQCRRSLSRQHN